MGGPSQTTTLVLGLFALIAGCIGGDAPAAEEVSETSIPDGAPTEALNESMDAVAEDVPEPVARLVNFSVSGNTGRYFCAWVEGVAGTCEMLQNREGGYTGDTDPAVQRVTATATWTAETPHAEQMTLAVFAITTECTDDCTDDDMELVQSTRGPSPLTIEVAGMTTRFSVYVWNSLYQEGVPMYSEVDAQPFTLEGQALTVPLPPM